MKKSKIVYIICLIALANINAQHTKVNKSLLNYLKTKISSETDPSKKCRMLNRIADEYFITYSIDSVKHYSEMAIKLAEENDLLEEAGLAYKNIARTSSFNTDKRNYITLKRDFYENINKAIKIFAGLNDKANLAESYRYLSKYYMEYHNQKMFSEYNAKAAEIYKYLNDSLGLAVCYTDLGKILSIQKKYEIAENFFRISLRILESAADTIPLASLLSNYSYFYKNQNKFSEQLAVAERAAELVKNIDNKLIIAFTYSDYGSALNNNNKTGKAISVLKIAYDNAQATQADVLMSQVCRNLSESYLQEKDYENAIRYKDSTFAHFTLYSRKANLEIAESEKYERELESNKLEAQARVVRITYLAVILVVLLLFFAVIYFIRQRSNKLLQEKIDIINSQNYELETINHQLEKRVIERTNDLTQKNSELEKEINLRRATESELIMAKEAAEEGSKLKTTLLANISHEFRTPLNGILGMTELLKEELAGSENTEYVNKIGRAGRRLLNTLNSVLTVMELASESYFSQKSYVNLRDLCIDLIKKFEDAAAGKNLIIKTEFETEDLCVCTDENILKRILFSLFDNAIKYSEDGTVVIRADSVMNADGNSEVSISIKDSGIGIKKEDEAFLFKEFRQLSEGYSRAYEGLGLGLVIAKRMVNIIGGRITWESEFGRGSEFKVWLPSKSDSCLEINCGAIDDIGTCKSLSTQKNSSKDYHFLVVEDNDLNAEIVHRYLSPFGSVDISTDAGTALEFLRYTVYDLLLIDINLGSGMNGITLLNEIKKSENCRGIPAVALTGYASSTSKQEFKDLGFTGYLAKPFEKRDLLRVVNEQLGID